jgi:hypothetical protein
VNGPNDAHPAGGTPPVSKFFLSRRQDLAACSHGALPKEDWALAEPLTPLQVSKLWAIVLNQDWSGRPARGAASVHGARELGQKIHKIPDPVLRQLARMTPQELVRVTSAWHEDPDPTTVAINMPRVVLDLVRLAARSRGTRRRVYFLWWDRRRG